MVSIDLPTPEPDGFEMSADPAAYVPRTSTERALAELTRGAVETRDPVALVAPAGLGKTMLLRVLASRLADRLHPLYLPFPALPQSELCALALGLLNVRAGAHPESDLLALSMDLRAAGSGLLLLVDDADALPRDTARGLAGLAAVSHGGLRLLFATIEGGEERLRKAVGPELALVRLSEPMTASETGAYIQRRLDRVRAGGAAREPIDPLGIARIHRESEGVPTRIHAAFGALAAALR
jgi:type II secretory pathway predicted ATPase ExeA